MADLAAYLALAREAGFTHIGELNTESLIARPEVREMCAAGRCKAYGASWSCPPACGSLEQTAKRMARYRAGILVQTMGLLEDDFDPDAIRAAEEKHKAAFEMLVRRVRLAEPNCLPLTAGGCRICLKCTYPDRPCRFPGRMLSSMEAYGLWVSDVCLRSGLAYNYGPRTMTYTSCILLNGKEE